MKSKTTAKVRKKMILWCDRMELPPYREEHRFAPRSARCYCGATKREVKKPVPVEEPIQLSRRECSLIGIIFANMVDCAEDDSDRKVYERISMAVGVRGELLAARGVAKCKK